MMSASEGVGDHGKAGVIREAAEEWDRYPAVLFF